MPSFSNLSRQASINDSPAGADIVAAFENSRNALGPAKPRMKHWSALPGPITEGFRRQREKQALQAQNPQPYSSPGPFHSSQTAPSNSDLQDFSPNQVMHPNRLRHLAPPAFNHAFQDDHQSARGVQNFPQIPASTSMRSFDPKTMEVIPVFPRYQVEDALGLPDNSHPEKPLAVEDLIPVYPIRQNSIRSLYDYEYVTPGLDGSPPFSAADMIPVTWPPLQPVTQPSAITPAFNAQPPEDYETGTYTDNRGRPEPSQKRAPKNYLPDRREADSPPAKSRSRSRKNSTREAAEDAPGPSVRTAPLKRRRSGTGLSRKKTKSFHEEYLDSVKRGGGKLPNDIDSFGFQDDGEEHWSTLDFFKKQKKKTEEENAQNEEGDLPSTYKTFQPTFKPKADKPRMIKTTNTFTLPIPAFNRLATRSAGTQASTTEIGTTSTRRRSLFAPPPLSAKPEAKGKVIEIMDDEEKQLKKKEVLKGLNTGTLGLVERIKPPSSDEAAESNQSGEYKSSLYKTSKLGDDMEATSSRPFSSLEHFNREDDESWTSSPPRGSSPLHASSLIAENAPSAAHATVSTEGDATTNDGQTDGATSITAEAQSLQPLAKNWTFKKFFSR